PTNAAFQIMIEDRLVDMAYANAWMAARAQAMLPAVAPEEDVGIDAILAPSLSIRLTQEPGMRDALQAGKTNHRKAERTGRYVERPAVHINLCVRAAVCQLNKRVVRTAPHLQRTEQVDCRVHQERRHQLADVFGTENRIVIDGQHGIV